MNNALPQPQEVHQSEASRPRLEVLGAQGGAPEPWRVGPYEIREQIGQGGMATVYRAWHTGLHRHEALKIPRRGLDGVDTEYIHRLLSEARTAARLHHPHIVSIHNISEDGAPHPYFSMDLIEGQNLAEVLAARGSLSVEESVGILKQAASALSHAHANGVAHRDIKPENILLQSDDGDDNSCVKVVDFGIARAGEDPHGTRLTRSGILVGTPEYMSPEQSGSGEVVDFRTDIYSLGVVAYEMLSGAPPFTSGDGVSRMAILISHVRDEPQLLHEINPNVSLELSAVVAKALAKNPAERYQSADEFLSALENFARENVADEKSQPQLGRASGGAATPLKLRAGWLGMALAVGIGVLIGALASLWGARLFAPHQAGPSQQDSAPRVSVALSSPAARRSTSVGSSTRRKAVRSAIAFAKQEHKNPAIAWGARKVLRAGKNGVRETVWQIVSQGGREISRRALSTRVVTAPLAQIEEVGSRPRNIDNVALSPSSSPATLPARPTVMRHRERRHTSSSVHVVAHRTVSTPAHRVWVAPKAVPKKAAPKITRRASPKVPSSKSWKRPARFYQPPRVIQKPRKHGKHKHDNGQVLGTFRLPSPTIDFRSTHS